MTEYNEYQRQVEKIINDSNELVRHSIKQSYQKGKQEAETGFAEWCNSQGWIFVEGKWSKILPIKLKNNVTDEEFDKKYRKTSEELYQMYLKWLEENGRA